MKTINTSVIPTEDVNQYPKLAILLAMFNDERAVEAVKKIEAWRVKEVHDMMYRKGHIMRDLVTGEFKITSYGETVLRKLISEKYGVRV